MLNPCELEIDLFCKGLRIPPHVLLDGARGIRSTRAGLGSGLEIAIPVHTTLKDEIWMNVPVLEAFARRSPYRLDGEPGCGYQVVDDREGVRYPVRVPREPAWYSRMTSRDVLMDRIGVLQGTYLAIYVNPVCAFWNYAPALNCRFCTTGRNVGVNEEPAKDLSDVVETCWAAKQESDVTFVHLNGGFQGSRGIDFVLPYVRAIKESVGLLVGVQLAPEPDFSRYDALIDAGVDHLSFCLELFDPEWFRAICPGKARVHGQQLYLDAMAYCAARMPRGSVSGEIVAGLEPIGNTLAAIDHIVSLGAFPTVCIFRPTVGADLEQHRSPDFGEMCTVMRHVYDACRGAWLPIGAAPNIEVSLVVNPDEASMLAPRTAGFYAYEAYRRVVRAVTRPVFNHRLRAAARPQAGSRGHASR
jgi:hypothetical protein